MKVRFLSDLYLKNEYQLKHLTNCRDIYGYVEDQYEEFIREYY